MADNNNDLLERRKKWKKTERFTFTIVIVLSVILNILTTVKELTDFNSIAYFVLAVIFSIFAIADFVILIISWFKLYRINKLIAEQGNISTDNDDNI